MFWVDLTFEWLEDMMVFRVCLFLFFSFRANGNKGQIDENNFRHCHDNFPESAILKVTWLQLCLFEKYHPVP